MGSNTARVALYVALTSTICTPAMASSGEVTEEAILAHADRHAPALRLARSRLGLAEAEVVAASPLLPEDPELELSMGPRLSAAGQAVELELSLSQQLEIAGQRGLRIQAAGRGRERSLASLEQARWRVHWRVHAAFHVAMVARHRVRAAAHRAAFAASLLNITRKRQAAGAVSMLHVRVAEGEVAQAEQHKIRADSGFKTACLTLALEAGWPAGAPLRPAGPLPTPRRPPPVSQLVQLALTRHPALLRQRAVLREAEARVALANRGVVPNPTLGVAYSREAEPGGGANHIVVGTLGLPIPLWQRNQGQRARTRAAASVARTQGALLRQDLRTRVTRAAVALDAGARRVAAYGSSAVPAFKRNLELIGRAFSAGKVDVLQVMVARGRFLEIQRETLDAYESYYSAHAALEAVVGAEIWPAAQAPAKGQEQRR